ncbi:Uncharacterized protein APZ42_008748, partial [Daphnia magna]
GRRDTHRRTSGGSKIAERLLQSKSTTSKIQRYMGFESGSCLRFDVRGERFFVIIFAGDKNGYVDRTDDAHTSVRNSSDRILIGSIQPERR